jgi:hypothetical protein
MEQQVQQIHLAAVQKIFQNHVHTHVAAAILMLVQTSSTWISKSSISLQVNEEPANLCPLKCYLISKAADAQKLLVSFDLPPYQ